MVIQKNMRAQVCPSCKVDVHLAVAVDENDCLEEIILPVSLHVCAHGTLINHLIQEPMEWMERFENRFARKVFMFCALQEVRWW